MSTITPYFSHGARNEQLLLEDLIAESIFQRGIQFFYIPRTLVGKDEILGEDRLSEFKTAFPVAMYLENVDGYTGGNFMIQKFGLMIEQSATLTISIRQWEQFVGKYGKTIIPNRPNEGDLIYFPLTKTLFHILYVEHQDPFYQLNKRFVYRLSIETFQYGSERIETGVDDIDVFEDLKSYDVEVNGVDVSQSYGDNDKFKDEGVDLIVDNNNPLGKITL